MTDLHDIYGGYTQSVYLFAPHQKKGKKGQKRVKCETFEKSQNFEKNIIFLKVYLLSTPFTLFVLFCKK